jgi:hypothetical protein
VTTPRVRKQTLRGGFAVRFTFMEHDRGSNRDRNHGHRRHTYVA